MKGSDEYDRLNSCVDRLLAGKRFPRYRAGLEEREAIRAAIWLLTARPGSELPDRAFMERLGRRLRAELGEAGSPETGPSRASRRPR